MVSETAREMIVAASNTVIGEYVGFPEYTGYKLLKEGDLDGLLDLAQKELEEVGISQSQLEQELRGIRANFPEQRSYWEETEQLIRDKGFEEYFLRQDVREQIMVEVIKYILDNPEEPQTPPGHDQLRYAFNHAIQQVLEDEQVEVLKKLAREHQHTDETYRERETGELFDPKLMGFRFGPLVDFVKNLYAREYEKDGTLI